MVSIGSLNSSSLDFGISAAKGSAVHSKDAQNSSDSTSSASQTRQLSLRQQQLVAELKQTETNVIAHEQAHLSAGRDLITSGPDYSYTYGPDGKRYISGGEVGIDTSPEQKPQENIDKGEHIVATALAPADPSAQDYSVAALGNQMAAQGRVALARERAAENAPSTSQADNAAQQKLAQSYSSSSSASPSAVNEFA